MPRPPLIPVPVCLIAILLALLVLAADAAATAFFFTRFMREVQTITVPASVDIDLGPDRPAQFVWRETHGPHLTINRPLLPRPDDLALTITDRRTGQTLDTTPRDWSQRMRILSTGYARRAVAEFTPPPHGQISVDIRGDFAHEQVYSVGPTPHSWNAYAGNLLAAVALGALLILALAIGALTLRALTAPPRIDLDPG